MIERYDLIVIGAGPAGLSAAIEAAKNGMKPICKAGRSALQADTQVLRFKGTQGEDKRIQHRLRTS